MSTTTNTTEAVEVSAEQARDLVSRRITELAEAGIVTLTLTDLDDLVIARVRSRAWLRKELLRRRDAGQLAALGGGRFGINPPDHDQRGAALRWSTPPAGTPNYDFAPVGPDLASLLVADRLAVMAGLGIYQVNAHTFVDLIRAGVRSREWFVGELARRAEAGQLIACVATERLMPGADHAADRDYVIRVSQVPGRDCAASDEIHQVHEALMTARRDELAPLSDPWDFPDDYETSLAAALVDRQAVIAGLETALLQRLLEAAGAWNCGMAC